MPKYTPGPWENRGYTPDRKAIVIAADTDSWERLRCEIEADDCDREMAEANAALITVAPEMLAACKKALNCLTSGDPESQAHPESPYHFLYAAIARAEKESS